MLLSVIKDLDILDKNTISLIGAHGDVNTFFLLYVASYFMLHVVKCSIYVFGKFF
jgi:hypothetical protein